MRANAVEIRMNESEEKPKTEIVVLAHGQHGTVKYVYLNAASAIEGMKSLTSAEGGFMIAQVYERERQHYNREKYPELHK